MFAVGGLLWILCSAKFLFDTFRWSASYFSAARQHNNIFVFISMSFSTITNNNTRHAVARWCGYLQQVGRVKVKHVVSARCSFSIGAAGDIWRWEVQSYIIKDKGVNGTWILQRMTLLRPSPGVQIIWSNFWCRLHTSAAGFWLWFASQPIRIYSWYTLF